MNHIKQLFLIVLIVICSSSIFASGFYLDSSINEFQIYTSNEKPQIQLEFESKSSEQLQVEKIKFDGTSISYSNLPRNISQNEKINLNFTFPNSIDLKSNPVDIKLQIKPTNEFVSDELELVGDPLEFTVNYLSSNTVITHYSSQKNPSKQVLSFGPIIRGDDEELKLHFEHPIVKYEFQVDNQYFTSEEFISSDLQDIPDTVSIDVSSLNSGSYDINVAYENIAGDVNTQTFILTIADLPLAITKVYTKADSNSYPYYFNSKFNTNEIYASTRNYDLVFETNYDATCYFEQAVEFKDYFNVVPITNQVKEHRIPVELFQSSVKKAGMWIMCENVQSPFKEEERVYLSEKIFNEKTLIDFIYLNPQNNFDITYSYPKELITFTPPIVEAHTNYDSFCEYSVGNKERYVLMQPNSNYLEHKKNDSINFPLGNIVVNLKCIDKVYNIAEERLEFEVNPQKDTQLVSWEPKYTATEYVDFEMEISDPNAQCGFISRLSSIGDNNISNPSLIEPTRKEGQKLFFDNIGPFSKEGKNDQLYLKCVNSESRVSEMNFYVIYDPTPPVVSEISLQNNYYGPTTKFSKEDYMVIDFEVDSDIIEYYTVEFKNSGIKKNFTSKPITILDNFSQDSSFSLQAFDKLERESKVVVTNYEFDKIKPTLDIKVASSSSSRKVSCKDGFDDCIRVEYGLSSINSSCTAKTTYTNSTEIDVFGVNYLCVNGYDEAGNKVSQTISVGSSGGLFIPQPVGEVNVSSPTINEGENEEDTQEDEDNTTPEEKDDDFNITGINIPEPQEEFNWVLLSAFAFILLLVGTGGYYAYSRGYLDDQLIAMGMKQKKKQEPIIGTDAYKPIPKKELPKTKIPQNKDKYDAHLDKLNDFIDSTINKNSKVFNEFDSNATKGNVKSFKDTLIKNQKSKEQEAKEFESFYKNQKSKKE